jgi:hypothetical protein
MRHHFDAGILSCPFEILCVNGCRLMGTVVVLLYVRLSRLNFGFRFLKWDEGFGLGYR